MDMQPILQMLDSEDFKKMLKACRSHTERFHLNLSRLDPLVPYHIHLPSPPVEKEAS